MAWRKTTVTAVAAPVATTAPMSPSTTSAATARADERDTLAAVARRTAAGSVWVLLALAGARILGFGGNLVLARLLSPADFGLVSFAMVVIGAASLLEDLGVPAAIIYGKREIREVAGTALSINILTSMLLFAVIAVGSPFLPALGRGHGEVAAVATMLAIGVVISSASSVQSALLQKRLAFRRKFLPDVLPVLVSAAASISFALLGFGAWSLVYGYLAKSCVSTALLWRVSEIRPWPQFNVTIARDLLRYGLPVSASSAIAFVNTNSDYLIVGSTLGAQDLGVYTLAFTVASVPFTFLSQPVTNVLFPAYARLSHDREAMIRLLADAFALVCAAAVGLGVIIWLLIPVLTSVVLGPKWARIVEPLRLMMAFGVLRAAGSMYPPVYKALGKPGLIVKVSLLKLVLLIPLLLFGVRHGITGVAIVQTAVAAVFMPLNSVILIRTLNIPVARLREIYAPALGSAVVAVLLLALATGVRPIHVLSTELMGSIGLAAVTIAASGSALLALNPRLAVMGRVAIASMVASRRWGAA